MESCFLNVGHGEAIILNLPGKMVLRDFGRAKSAKKTQCSVSLVDISNYLHRSFCDKIPRSSRIEDVILSHAHEDHFNGFELLYEEGVRKCFENCYIPMFQMKEIDSLGALLVQVSLFLYHYYGPETYTAKKAKHWLLAAPIMAGLSKRVFCVSAGHTVLGWGIPNKFLWPLSVYCPSSGAGYYFKLKKYFEVYVRRNLLQEEDSGFLGEYFTLLGEDSKKVVKILQEYFVAGESEQSENGLYVERSPEEVEGHVYSIVNIMNNRAGMREDLRSYLKTRPIHVNFLHRKAIDNHSVIFEIGKEKEHLYLSDADDKTIGDMLSHNGTCQKKYYLIKSSHHGNRGARALRSKRVTARCVFNCCGPANSNWRGPDDGYTDVSKVIFCSDWKHRHQKWLLSNSFRLLNRSHYCFPLH